MNHPSVTARIVDQGLLDCFDAGLTDADGEPVNAEISAAAFDGKKLLMASDKPVPGSHRSDIFSVPFSADEGFTASGGVGNIGVSYYTMPEVETAIKFEDFALTPDWCYVIATTGFDRVADNSTELDHYNTLLIWPLDHPDAMKVIYPSRQSVTSSVDLRQYISRALHDQPYFKIEGLATLPADGGHMHERLLLGIREEGEHHQAFNYTLKVLAVSYEIRDGQLEFTGDLELAYSFDPSGDERIGEQVGLSSVEYDVFNDRVFLLSSFEKAPDDTPPQLGGYLWVMSMEDFANQRPPTLVVDGQGAPLRFINKPEGVAVIDAATLFIVYDNDRVLTVEGEHGVFTREPHQAPYTVLRLE